MNSIIYDFSDYDIKVIWIIFACFSLLMIFSSIMLPRILVNLFKKTKIDSVFIGVFFLSIITSVPEILSIFILSLSKGETGIQEAIANIWGANIWGITVICLLDFIYFRFYVFKNISNDLKKTSFVVVFLNLLFFIFLYEPKIFSAFYFLNFDFNLIVFLIIFIYLVFLFYLQNNLRKQKKIKEKNSEIDYFKFKKNNFFWFLILLIFIFILIFSMLFIFSLSEEIKIEYDLNESVIGGFFFALLTSSPEIWSAISFFKVGLGLAAIGTVLGSHLFNIVVFVFIQDFILNNEKIIFASNVEFQEQKTFLFFVLFSSLLLYVNIIRPISHKKQDYLFLPFLLIFTFLFWWINIFLN